MNFLITIATMVFAITLLGAIVILIFKLKLSQECRQKNQMELERSIFRYEQDYFSYIGHEHPEAVAFRHLVETKNLKGLLEQWGKLSTSFVQLETKAGWHGRPLIMDYYYSYEEDLAALAKLLLNPAPLSR